jgi:signal transduction histidine kinase
VRHRDGLEEPVDLADLASAAVAATRTTDPAARVELAAAGPVPATGDRDALLRAVRNLLDNAFAVLTRSSSKSAGRRTVQSCR